MLLQLVTSETLENQEDLDKYKIIVSERSELNIQRNGVVVKVLDIQILKFCVKNFTINFSRRSTHLLTNQSLFSFVFLLFKQQNYF